MPAFDIVSEVDKHELTNAVDQANRELSTRFDFRGTDARVEQSEKLLTMYADSDFQLEQLLDILRLKLAKRSIDVKCLEVRMRDRVHMMRMSAVRLHGGVARSNVEVGLHLWRLDRSIHATPT